MRLTTVLLTSAVMSVATCFGQSTFTALVDDVRVSITSNQQGQARVGFKSGIGPSRVEGHALNRYLIDDLHHEYLAYSILVNRVPNEEGYRLTLGEALPMAQDIKLPNPSEWSRMQAHIKPVASRTGELLLVEISDGPLADGQVVDTIRSEDLMPCNDNIRCLSSSLMKLEGLLFEKIQAVKSAGSPLQQASVERAQDIWITFRSESCSITPSGSASQFACEIRLTRSRLDQLNRASD